VISRGRRRISLQGTTGTLAQIPEVLGAHIGEFVVLAVGPDVFDWVQFRRVGRQILHGQSAFLVADELLGDDAAVRRESVPNQQDVAGDVAEQVFEELDDLFGLDGAFENLKVEVPQSDAGDDR
jgi:hypothetical protein